MTAPPVNVPPIAIEVEGLRKTFGERVVVDNLSMSVQRGQIYGFLGPNGSGKTTTIRMLCGLLTPDAGRGTCLGLDILTQAREIRRHVGYMTQKFSLYTDLSVRENLEFVARLYGVPRPRPRRRPWCASGWKGAAGSWRANSRAGGSSGWRWAPASCRSRNCCCWTNPPPASTRRRAGILGEIMRWPPRA